MASKNAVLCIGQAEILELRRNSGQAVFSEQQKSGPHICMAYL